MVLAFGVSGWVAQEVRQAEVAQKVQLEHLVEPKALAAFAVLGQLDR